MIEKILSTAAGKMDRTLEVVAEDFAAIRTGRANAAMFSKIVVEYYGAPTPLQQLASLTIPEPRTVMVDPYDKSAIPDIERALRESDLGANPSDDGNVIRVVLPELTAERRKEYVKLAKTKAEDARVGVRSARRKAKEELDAMKKDGEAGEDEIGRAQGRLESMTKSHVEQIDELLERKETELLAV